MEDTYKKENGRQVLCARMNELKIELNSDKQQPRKRGKRGRVMMEARSFSLKIPDAALHTTFASMQFTRSKMLEKFLVSDTGSKDAKVFKALEVSKIPSNIQGMLTWQIWSINLKLFQDEPLINIYIQ